MANDSLSDEEYYDSLLKKITSNEGNEEESMTDSMDADSLIQELLKNTSEEELKQEQKPAEALSFERLKQSTAQSESMIMGEKETEESSEDFLKSLDSIVKEVQDETEEIPESAQLFKAEQPLPQSEESSEVEELDDSLNILDTSEEELKQEETNEKAENDTKEQKKKSQKKVFKKEIDVEKIETEKNSDKKSFWNKLKNIFFKVEVVEEDEEGFSEEERALKESKEKEKKNKKEEALVKKEAAKKEKEQKKQENDQKKQAAKEAKGKKKQEKKEKKAEKKAQREPVERVKIKPVFLIFMLTVISAFVMLIMFSSNSLAYGNNINNAEKYLERQKYELAYNELAGLKIKKENEILYEKVRVLMLIEKQYNSYINFMNLDMPKQALDSLAKAVAQYDKNIDKADALGIAENMNPILDNVNYALQTEFNLSVDDIRVINQIEDKNEYTRQIETYTIARTK
ncbi:MAG: hypothetical protein HFI05_13100 [Lachnospiraceae bacterium]|nr:hypothetical protein [Lachnospiraceae bacterium]